MAGEVAGSRSSIVDEAQPLGVDGGTELDAFLDVVRIAFLMIVRWIEKRKAKRGRV